MLRRVQQQQVLTRAAPRSDTARRCRRCCGLVGGRPVGARARAVVDPEIGAHAGHPAADGLDSLGERAVEDGAEEGQARALVRLRPVGEATLLRRLPRRHGHHSVAHSAPYPADEAGNAEQFLRNLARRISDLLTLLVGACL